MGSTNHWGNHWDESNKLLHEGKDFEVGNNIILTGFKDRPLSLWVGDNVKIDDFVRICVGGTLTIDDNVTLHNHVSILGNGDCHIKRGSWIAQYTALDCEGGLEIGEDCCIGFNCQIWSHVKRSPYIPNMRFDSIKKTAIGNRVWLMGGLITVSPGVTLADDCVIFSNSVVSHDTEPMKVYAGIPAKELTQYKTCFKEQYDPTI